MVERIRLLDEGVDISDVMEDVNRVLDESIEKLRHPQIQG